MENQTKPSMNIYIDSNNFYKNAVQLLGESKVKFNWGSLVLGIRDIIQKDYDCNFSKAIYKESRKKAHGFNRGMNFAPMSLYI